MTKAKILIVDDEAKMRRILELMLSPDGYSIDLAEDGRHALSLLSKQSYDLVITDLNMPNLTGIELLTALSKQPMPPPGIVITAFGSVESAVESMKHGAVDYITKPFEKEMIRIVVSKALANSTLRRENKYLREEIGKKYSPGELVGDSPQMAEIYELVNQVSRTTSTVLITGESGTGKELLARAIHYGSQRSDGPFIAINCASIPDSLLESELFGYEKGAFTGADKSKLGKFELANGGTVFLDEIAEMSPYLQAKMLRALQERTFERLGGTKKIEVDIRLIAATNRDLKELIANQQFREDLYYRLNVFPIHLPPLRERKSDIGLLAASFVEKFNQEMGKFVLGFSPEAVGILRSYSWPGNVRELQNVIERAVILCNGGEITAKELNVNRAESSSLLQQTKAIIRSGCVSLEDIEKNLIVAALEISNNNQVHAAKLLNTTRNTLCYRMKKFEIASTGDQ
jgi:DNA-binding NtrC family response regulator